MTLMEKLRECWSCALVDKCEELYPNAEELEDETGHCTIYQEDEQWKK